MDKLFLYLFEKQPLTGIILLFVLCIGVVVGYLTWMKKQEVKAIKDPCKDCKYKENCDNCTYKINWGRMVNGIDTSTKILGEQNTMISALQNGHDRLFRENIEIKEEVKEVKQHMLKIAEHLERGAIIQNEILTRIKLHDRD